MVVLGVWHQLEWDILDIDDHRGVFGLMVNVGISGRIDFYGISFAIGFTRVSDYTAFGLDAEGQAFGEIQIVFIFDVYLNIGLLVGVYPSFFKGFSVAWTSGALTSSGITISCVYIFASANVKSRTALPTSSGINPTSISSCVPMYTTVSPSYRLS